MAKPTEDRLFIRPLPLAEKTGSGLYIPEDAKGKPTQGEVIAIGDAVNDKGEPVIKCKIGDHVMFPEHAGTDFNIDDLDLRVIRWSDIQAILDRNIENAEEIIRSSKDVSFEFFDTVLPGTVKEKVLLKINGKPFMLQGNILEPMAE